MKALCIRYCFILLAVTLMSSGCDDGGPGPEPEPEPEWQLVFEDHFDGTTVNTDNWTQLAASPPHYSLTGNGELQIDGSSGADEEGAIFAYNSDIPNTHFRVLAEFRTTQSDPIEDDVDIVLLLNSDGTLDNGYRLVLSSDPDGDSRDYTLLIANFVDGDGTLLSAESMGGTTPQITAGHSYVLEGVNNDGTITFAIKDGNGDVLKSISAVDETHAAGRIGFEGDLNIGTSGLQSIFFNYLRVEKYE